MVKHLFPNTIIWKIKFQISFKITNNILNLEILVHFLILEQTFPYLICIKMELKSFTLFLSWWGIGYNINYSYPS